MILQKILIKLPNLLSWLPSPGRLFTKWFEDGRMTLGLKGAHNQNKLLQKLIKITAGHNRTVPKALSTILEYGQKFGIDHFTKNEIRTILENKRIFLNPKQLNMVQEGHGIWREINHYNWRIRNVEQVRILREEGWNKAFYNESSNTYHIISDDIFKIKEEFDALQKFYEENGMKLELRDQGWNNPIEMWDLEANAAVQVLKVRHDSVSGRWLEQVWDEAKKTYVDSGRDVVRLRQQSEANAMNPILAEYQYYNFAVRGGKK